MVPPSQVNKGEWSLANKLSLVSYSSHFSEHDERLINQLDMKFDTTLEMQIFCT